MFHSCAGLRWHLKRSQHVKQIRAISNEWPCEPALLQDLSTSLIEVSSNLKHLEDLVSLVTFTTRPPSVILLGIEHVSQDVAFPIFCMGPSYHSNFLCQ